MSDRILIGMISGGIIGIGLWMFGIINDSDKLPKTAKMVIGALSIIVPPLGFIIMIGTLIYIKSNNNQNDINQNNTTSPKNPYSEGYKGRLNKENTKIYDGGHNGGSSMTIRKRPITEPDQTTYGSKKPNNQSNDTEFKGGIYKKK